MSGALPAAASLVSVSNCMHGLACKGRPGRAQALERDLSSVRRCEGERAPMLQLGRPVGLEGERAEPDWSRGLAERRRERLAG